MAGNNGINTSSGTTINTSTPNQISATDFNVGSGVYRSQPIPDNRSITTRTSGTRGSGVKAEDNATTYGALSAAIPAAASAVQNILNANSAYDALKEQNKMNAFELDRAEGILLQSGHQTILDIKRQGEENAVQAQLALAAQGQNLSSAGAEKASDSYNAIAIQNAMIEEINMMREVYDINFQRIEMRRAEGIAKAQKKNALFSGILTVSAAAAGGALGGAAGAAAAGAAVNASTSKDLS